ncbi:DUF6220 domain-containing protein [Dictyobacter formicarum]|uniref:Uncharacterized protein n=1 Tax=Dictyobacter formicarum TaxID=2778368 RepID=A0ABQ3VP93_9CHLR|nr:DUF6220 domain-containing protein [Dictyobacter formicarum]GHO88062.1 hypothetical protein KSZ_60680 [Dictyobacter formicarum]
MRSTLTHSDAGDVQHRQRRPIRRWAAWSYFGFGMLFILCIIIQVFFAGVGILVSGSWMIAHAALGSNLVLLPIVLLALSFAARLPGALKWLTLLLFVLVALQPVLIYVRASAIAILAGLHTVNALAIFTLSLFVNRHIWRLLHT